MTNLETHMHDWLFHYNIYTSNWEAGKRGQDMFGNQKGLITSSSLTTLIGLINKTDGDEKELDKLIDNDDI